MPKGVWELVSWKVIPRSGLLWNFFLLGLILPAPLCFLHVVAGFCSSGLHLSQWSGHEKTYSVGLGETSSGLSCSKCLKHKKGGWKGGKTPPWIEKLRLHVLVCEEAAEEGSRRTWMKLHQTGPHTHISFDCLSKFYEHLVLAPKSFQLRDLFFY